MILRRLANGIREQNWFTVVLEVSIVVVGIFIGLQVDDWNQARKDRGLEARYLERLYSDTLFNLAGIEANAGQLKGRAAILLKAIELLEAGTIDKLGTVDGQKIFCYWYILEDVPLRSSTFDELVSTGSLRLIRDPLLRQQLQLSRAEHERAELENEKIGPFIAEIARFLRPYVKWNVQGEVQNPDNAELQRASCTTDLAAMAGDRDMISILAQIYRAQIILANIRFRELVLMEKLLLELERVIPGEGP